MIVLSSSQKDYTKEELKMIGHCNIDTDTIILLKNIIM